MIEVFSFVLGAFLGPLFLYLIVYWFFTAFIGNSNNSPQELTRATFAVLILSLLGYLKLK